MGKTAFANNPESILVQSAFARTKLHRKSNVQLFGS